MSNFYGLPSRTQAKLDEIERNHRAARKVAFWQGLAIGAGIVLAINAAVAFGLI